MTCSARAADGLPETNPGWTWDSAQKTLSDGEWTLTATASGTNLTVTGWTAGSGTLNLLGTVTNGTGGGYAITSIGSQAFRDKLCVTNLYLPRTLTTIGNYAFYHCYSLSNGTVVLDTPALTTISELAFAASGASADLATWDLSSVQTIGNDAFAKCALRGSLRMPAIRTIAAETFQTPCTGSYITEIIPGESLVSIGNDAFNGQIGVTNLTLGTPKLTSIGLRAFYNAGSSGPSLGGDMSAWQLDSLTNIGNNAFISCTNLRGKLTLPAIQAIGASAFANAKGSSLPRELELGTNFTTFASLAFQGWEGLTTLTIDGTNTLTVAADAFKCANDWANPQTRPTRVVFCGPAPETTALDNFLVGVLAETAPYSCTIAASKRQSGWKTLARTSLTEDEASQKPADCFGVYDGNGKHAWLVQADSPYDSKFPGFSVRIQ